MIPYLHLLFWKQKTEIIYWISNVFDMYFIVLHAFFVLIRKSWHYVTSQELSAAVNKHFFSFLQEQALFFFM